jgi:RNA polymerase sigma-70 factor (ECF subfamily)
MARGSLVGDADRARRCCRIGLSVSRDVLPAWLVMSIAELELTDRMEAHRAELAAYCGRMLGSSFEAEDAVQETLLRAWRAAGRFEGRASLRTWLYRIATNVCFDTANARSRRPVPVDELPEPGAGCAELDPAELALTRETARLGLIAAIGKLPPRQRAALLLRDVLCWQASEIAELLSTSPAAVNSALQRARATLDRIDPERVAAITDRPERELLARYLAALHADDVDGLVSVARAEL